MSNNLETIDYEQHRSSGLCVRFYLKTNTKNALEGMIISLIKRFSEVYFL